MMMNLRNILDSFVSSPASEFAIGVITAVFGTIAMLIVFPVITSVVSITGVALVAHGIYRIESRDIN